MKKLAQNFLLSWLRWLASLQLLKNKPVIIGVTGSAGKTSTVKAIGEVLKTKYLVKYTTKGNSETGIPFELLNIPVKNYTSWAWVNVFLLSLWRTLLYWPRYKYLVVEMGIDSDQSPKNMEYLLKIIKPQVGIFLNVNNVHGQNFKGANTIQAITLEKGKLLASLPTDGLAIYSKDQPEIVKIAQKNNSTKKNFSINQQASMQLLGHQVDLDGTKFVFLNRNQQYVLKLKNQVHFKESFGNFAAALLAGEYLGVSIQDGINVLENNFKLLPGRMSVVEGINNSIILDSSYNSSLEPTSAALRMLNQISTRGKRIAILGDMREIGKNEKLDHEKLAEVAAKNADEIILVGPLTKKYILPKLRKLKFAKAKTHSFIAAHEAIEATKALVKPHDLILIKGSQNTIFLEIIVKAIMAQPEKAKQLLCRQTKYWDKQRKGAN